MGREGKDRKKGKKPKKSKEHIPLPPSLEPQGKDDETEFEEIPDDVLPDVRREVQRIERKEQRRKEKDRVKKKRPKGVIKARIAGVFLVIVLLLGVLNALVVLWEGSQVQSPDQILAENVGSISGRVTDSKGVGIEGAEVTVIGANNNAFTNPEGWYLIRSVSVGVYRVQVDKANYTSVIKKYKVEENMPRPLNFQLEPGSSVKAFKTNIPGQQTDLQQSYAWSVVIGLVASIMAGIGAFLSFNRARYRTVMVCAAVGILSYGFLFGSLFSILALIIVVAARPAFVPPELYCRKISMPTTEYEMKPLSELSKEERALARVDAATSSEGMPGHVMGIRSGKVHKGFHEDEEVEALGDEVEPRAHPEEEPVIDAEVREDLVAKAMESEGEVEETEARPPETKKKKEIKEAGPEILPEMEKALKETLASPQDTEIDIISSVLQKLELNKAHEPLKPPKKKKKKKRRGLKAHQKRALCRICIKPIIVAADSVHCNCGRTYHVHCAKDIGRCKNCGRKLDLED